MNELEYSDFLKEETDLEREAGLILEHHGIKGQRWGVRRTPEQLGHKTGGGLKGAISSLKKKRAAAKKKAAKKKAAKAKVQEKKQEESDEKIREKLLDSTDPAFIYKYRKLLDSKELQDRIDRINKEQKIKDLIPDPNAKRKKTMKSGEEFLKSAASMADSVGKIYDTYNKISGGNKKDSGGGKQNQQGGGKKPQNQQGGGKKPQNQNENQDQNQDTNPEKKDSPGKSHRETRRERNEAAVNLKATQKLFEDPGIQALLALGMAASVEPNQRNKKSHGSNS